MSIRSWISTAALNTARSLGRTLGCELVVETSEHSIETSMEHADTDQRAWDPGMFKHGQLFVEGYANPIKPSVNVRNELEDPDTVDVEESEQAPADDADSDSDSTAENVVPGDDDDSEHVALISSPRYRKYMRQDLISQLLTPKEQWRLIAYGVLGLAGLQFLAIIVTMYATGSF